MLGWVGIILLIGKAWFAAEYSWWIPFGFLTVWAGAATWDAISR